VTIHKNSYQKFLSLALALLLVFSFSLSPLTLISTQAAQAFANPAFTGLWGRTDKLVADGKVSRSFLWGPEPLSAGISEDYTEAPGGKRLVQYFDKSRMELTNPDGDQSSVYYITNGLIAKELMSGQVQLGDSKFEQRSAAEIGVAGDSDDTDGPTYKALNELTQATTENTNNPATGAIDRQGSKRDGTADFGKYNVTFANFVKDTGHNIAKPFWDYLNQTGPILNPAGQQGQGRIFEPVFFATGLPITEAWWAKVKVGGQVKDVLVQAFERRILTYTPANEAAFQVEMGNVGQHYYKWRYGNTGPTIAPPPTTTPQPTTTPPTTPGTGPVPAAQCLPAVTTAGDEVQACVSNAAPAQNTEVAVYGRLVVAGKAISGITMNTTWNYKSTTSSCSGNSGGDGVAGCTLKIGGATRGFKVIIDVKFNYNGKNYNGSTNFTTQ